MRVVGDREICVASGVCAMVAPEVFDQDDKDGRVVVTEECPGAQNEQAARDAVRLCPSGALSLEEEE